MLKTTYCIISLNENAEYSVYIIYGVISMLTNQTSKNFTENHRSFDKMKLIQAGSLMPLCQKC